MISIPYLRTQAALVVELQRVTRDQNNYRWSLVEKQMAINDALQQWYNRVSVPRIHTLTDGWSVGQTDYILPGYIRGHIDPQQRRYNSNWLHVSGLSSEADSWVDMAGFSLEPGDGGMSLRLDFSPAAGDARIIWWGYNGLLPLAETYSGGSLTADSTSVTLDIAVDVGDAGYIKMGNEWMGYSGVEQGAVTTLLNLVRGINNTTATTHTTETGVLFGVAAHRADLFTQLMHSCQAFLHRLYLTDGLEQETTRHERQALYYQQLADEYWRKYVPNRAMKLRLGRGGIGAVMDGSAHEDYQRTWGARL